MNPGIALFIAPVVYLAQLTGMFALVPWACSTQHGVVLHAINALALVICLGATGYALSARLAFDDRSDDNRAGAAGRRRFVAIVALYLGAVISVVLVAQWITVWFIPPCVS